VAENYRPFSKYILIILLNLEIEGKYTLTNHNLVVRNNQKQHYPWREFFKMLSVRSPSPAFPAVALRRRAF